MDKLIKQLKRDFKKNPKKVVLLGGLFAICLWVVFPLIFPPEEKKPVRRTPAATAAVTPPADTATGATIAAAAPTWRWQDLDRALVEDPRMRSAGDERNTASLPARNPFETEFDVDAAMDELLEDIGAELAAEKVAEAVSTPATVLFESVPLELTSTILGGAQSIAVINGRPFSVGSKIGTSYEKDVVLKSVEPRSAVVEWNGLTRTLRIMSPKEQPPRANLAGLRTTP